MENILQRILKTRILAEQHGFRERRSTVTAQATLQNCVNSILMEYIYCALISLNSHGAFDSLDWYIAA